MNSVLATEVQKGKLRPNWTKYIGEVNSILNRQCGWAKNDVSAYANETVFGIDFDPIMPDTRDNIRRCTKLSKSAWMCQLAVDSVPLWNPYMT
jgi:hypothetical protein